MSLRAEFKELSAEDRANELNLKAAVWEGEHIVAHVLRLAPSKKEDRFGDHSERRFVCSCWRAEGIIALRENCVHIRCVEDAIAANAQSPRPAA